MVEHRTPNPGVGGSSPSWPASLISTFFESLVKKLRHQASSDSRDNRRRVYDN